MSPTTLRILIALFLIAHALVHVTLTFVPLPVPGKPRTPFFPSWWRDAVDPLWPVMRLHMEPERTVSIGWGLWIVQLICFVLAGLGLLGVPVLSVFWRGLALYGAASSMIFLVLYWHPWLVVGVIIDLAIIAGYIMSWPASLFS
jgi:hypothetical protein